MSDDLPPRTYTLREAAELCESSPAAMRKRADRGTLRTVLVDGIRRVPSSELERAGLLPDGEVRALRAEVEALQAEVARARRLTENAESAAAAEEDARGRAEAAMHEARAHLRVQAEAAEELGERVADLEAFEAEVREAGPIKAYRLARQRRRELADLAA